MHPTFELDYIFSAIGFIFVLFILVKRILKLWLRFLVLFFVPPFISAILYAILVTSSGPFTTGGSSNNPDIPIETYTFTSVIGYCLGRLMLPNIIFCVTYLIIKLSKKRSQKMGSREIRKGI
jgi:hypothetical protein